MTADKTLRFRPAVVVCVGEQGRKVGAQLDLLLAEWVEQGDPRRSGVAIIEVDEPAGGVDRLLSDFDGMDGRADGQGAAEGEMRGGWMQSRLDAERATGTPRRAGDVPLSRLMVEALRGRPADADDPTRYGVLDDHVVWSIEEAGYVVPRAMAVIWVVAAASSPLLEAVTREVRHGLDSERVDNWVLLALPNPYPRDPEQHAQQARACSAQPWHELLVSADGGAPLATYAYVFETQSERGTFWEGEDDVDFAAAEAIFVLTASGITTTREYEDMLRRSLPSMVSSPYERMSGVGTSRLIFPRAQVEEYCASELGAELLRLWARSEEMDVAPVAASTQKAAARTVLTQLRNQTGDSAAVMRGGRPSPRVSAEGVSRARPMPRPMADGGLIFTHFSQGELDRLADGRRDIPTRLDEQRRKAEEGFAVWSQAIRPAWERSERAIDRALTSTAGELVLEGAGGVARARTYLDEVRSLLITERERMARQREARAVVYERFLHQMEMAAEGSWLADPAPQPSVMQSSPASVFPQSAALPAPTYVVPQATGPHPVYQTYPPAQQAVRPLAPTFPPSTPPAYGSGFVPGFATTNPPPIAPVSYRFGATPPYTASYAPGRQAGRVPVVPVLSGPGMNRMDGSGPWRWVADPSSQASGSWRLVNSMGWPVGAVYASGVSAPYAPNVSAPYAPGTSGPLPDPADAPESGPIAEQRPPYTPYGQYGPASSYPSSFAASGPIADPNALPAQPFAPSRPLDTSVSGPIALDSPTDPSGLHAVVSPPMRDESYSGPLQPPPLPSYLAPAAPAYQTDQSLVVPVALAEPPSREERLIAKLTMRVRHYEARRPRSAALAGVSLVALAPLVFLAQVLVPHAWLDRPFGILYLTLGVAVLVGAVAAGYAQLRARELHHAVEDLRDVYRRSFANRCERHEDVRREAVVAGLLAHVRRMVDRLSQWDTFASTMAETMETEAAGVDRSLFDGALGRRNVLVANRRRLHPLSYRLANLEVDVSTKRRRHPMDGYAWHGDLSAMLPRLRSALRGGKSLLEADPGELVVPIRSFCAGIVRPYLVGEIADLSAAFETLPPSESTMYFDALMARSAILYRPADPPTGAISFVAAHDEHQGYVSGKRQHAEPITLPIEDRGWLGVLRLFPGGSLPTFRLQEDAQRTPVLREPLWQSGEMPAVRTVNSTGLGQWSDSQGSASFGVRAPDTQRRMGRPSAARQSLDRQSLDRQSLDRQMASAWQPEPPAQEDGWLLDNVTHAPPTSPRVYASPDRLSDQF